ncbi:MAG TPA: SGNH/GDSL hydrolase family protein [Amycolatopsis sp.]|nr:SGNH/GDSL hydrolase family protein [Amycolatopsis sp.]
MRRFAAATVAVVTATVLLVATPASAASVQVAWCDDQSRVALIGTSADTGYGTTGYSSPDDTFARTRYGWVTKISNDLTAQWQTVTTDYSHNGAMASDYLPGGRWSITTGALGDIASTRPPLVLIDLGGNEYWAQHDPAVLQTQLGQIIDQVRAARPDVTILLSIYPELNWQPNAYASTKTWDWSAYGSAIYNTAVTKQTALIDLRQTIPPAADPVPTNPNVWTSDGIHLNDAGNLAEYGIWWGWVSSLASVC